MKTALIHDWLPLMGGAERVLEAIFELFPGPIHTLIYETDALQGSKLASADVRTSFIQKLPFSPGKYRSYLPFFPMAIEQFNLSAYDVVISSSYAVAKGALTNANQLHICYCHSPMRYAWDLHHQYLEDANLTQGVKGFLAKSILHYLRIWDVSSVNRVDYFIANSNYIARRIKKIYNRDATVIYPPVDVDRFELCEQKEDFYLTASRLVPYKKVDLIVDAFNQMPDKQLIVIGDGPEFKKISQQAGVNIKMLGYQEFNILKEYMQKAKAFVFAADEDFGITPVEAQACGTPVIAFGKGGALETVVNGKTGLWFKEQTVESLLTTVDQFEKTSHLFEAKAIRANAESFSKEIFNERFKSFVDAKYAEHFK